MDSLNNVPVQRLMEGTTPMQQKLEHPRRSSAPTMRGGMWVVWMLLPWINSDSYNTKLPFIGTSGIAFFVVAVVSQPLLLVQAVRSPPEFCPRQYPRPRPLQHERPYRGATSGTADVTATKTAAFAFPSWSLPTTTAKKSSPSTARGQRPGCLRHHRSNAPWFYHVNNHLQLYPHSLVAATTFELKYGRNMDIWPPVGYNDIIRIQDSFPQGIVPTTTTTTSILHQTHHLSHINKIGSYMNVLVLFCTIFTGSVVPMDLLCIITMTGYFIVLQQWAQSLRGSSNWNSSSSTSTSTAINDSWTTAGITRPVVLPTLPPVSNHVPYQIQYPLGYRISQSRLYRSWQWTGTLLGQTVPFGLLLLSWISTNVVGLSIDERYYFWMIRCLLVGTCQRMTEHVSDHTTDGIQHIPLPIRGLIPVMYNTVRLLYLWQWIRTIVHPTTILSGGSSVTSFYGKSYIGYILLLRALPIMNMLYTVIHLFGFVLPVMMVRYFRNYFYMVEAKEVQFYSYSRNNPDDLL
jgi:hypothetical protein